METRNPFTLNRLSSLVIAPVIWAVHFLLCYLLTAIACALGFGGVRVGIGVFTLIALALLGYVALLNFRKWTQARDASRSTREATHDAGVSAFFALNSLMLCGLSAIALIWVAAPAAMLSVCAA